MKNLDEQKIALEDSRIRQMALLDLIYFTDRQALSLLRLYITLAIATATGSVAAFASTHIIAYSVAIGLVAATFILMIGSYYCLRAIEGGKLGLPGRGADFWKAALENDVSFSEVVLDYLTELERTMKINRKINKRNAIAFNKAKWWGTLAPLGALSVGTISNYFS